MGLNILLMGMFKPVLIAQVYSDTTWERLYYFQNEDERTYSNNHIETYDKGYLLATYLYQDNTYKPKLFKTDVNGYYLWDRLLDTTDFFGISAITESQYGEIYICGSTHNNVNTMPWVSKLNACGEIEWCKIFEWDETSYAIDIETDHNNDIIVLTSYYGNSPGERINLIKLDTDGELIWKKNYATIEDHPWIWNAQGNQLIISESNDYYITGRAQWPTNNDPQQGGGLRPFFIKVKENGIEDWVLPFGIYNNIFGNASKSIQINDTLFLSIASDWLPEPPTTLFIWYSDAGEIYYYNSKHIEIEGQWASYIHDPILLDNNKLWGILLYHLYPEDPNSRTGYIQLDTSMNIISYLEDDRWGGNGPKDLIQTFNNKFLTVSTMQEDVPGFIYDIYISKRNEDYSFDTVYTNWLGTYDSLCPHAIESGYLDYECETIVVGTSEVEKPKAKELEIKLSPNPATNKVNISFENNTYKQLHLQLLNINGEELYSKILLAYPQSEEIDIGKLPKGVYLVVLRNNSLIVGRAKLVVE